MGPMFDRLFFPAVFAIAFGMVALAAVWPQGLGDRSPAPFGHEPVQRTAEARAAMKRATEASERKLQAARDAVADSQARMLSPTR